jgi:ABC-type nitrate/sulfonate/bicarbonate transport system substrate-binding protein
MIVGIIIYNKISQKQENKKPDIREKVSVLLDWTPNTNHTGLYVALDKGYFDSEGLDVVILQPGEGENNQAVAAGKADFGISSQESVIQARSEGLPVVSIAAIIQHNTSGFASLEKSNITSVKNFEGKRYGGWGSPIEETVIKALMQDHKADYSKIKNITIGTTDFFKTIGRDSDFQWIFYGWDGVEAKRRGMKLNILMLKDLDPIFDYYTPVIITNEEHLNNRKDQVFRFMKAVKKGYNYAIENPLKAAAILYNKVPELNKELVEQSQLYLSKEYKSDASVWGLQKEKVWSRYISWLSDHKLIKNNIETQKSYTNEFVTE